MTDQIHSVLEKSTRIVVVSHVRPDGDALGSQRGLGLYLRKLGKQPTMFTTEVPTRNLAWLFPSGELEIYEETPEQQREIQEADTVVILDTNCADRIGRLARPIRESSATTIVIDHHPEPENWFDLVWTEEKAAAAGELVYKLIAGHRPDLIDSAIAEALYTAIMTDTGSFRFSSVTAQVHRVVADLIERGNLPVASIHSRVYDRRSTNGLQLLGQAIESIQLAYGGKLGYMVVTEDMLNATGAAAEDTSGFIDYVLSVDGVEVAVIFKESDGEVKMSFRSKGAWPVHEWARSCNGGGHRNASGALISGKPLEDVIDMVIRRAPRYIPQLDDVGREAGQPSPEGSNPLSAMEA